MPAADSALVRAVVAATSALLRATSAAIPVALRAVRGRRSHLGLACVAAGLAGAPLGGAAAIAACAVAAPVAAVALGSRAALVAVVLVCAGATSGTARLKEIDGPTRAAPPGAAIDAHATVLDRPRATRFGWAATLRIDGGPAHGLRVYARADDAPRPETGMRVRVRGIVRDSASAAAASTAAASGVATSSAAASASSAPTSTAAASAAPASSAPARSAPASTASAGPANAGAPGTPGFGPLPRAEDADAGFDFAAFLRSRGIGRELKVESIRPLGRRGGLAGAVDAIRRRAERAIGAGLSADRAALARGMVLGEDGDVSAETRDDFRRSGLAHLLAASGQNVMLMFALALPLLMLAGARPRVRVVVLLSLVGLYVPLAGGGASVERAGVMAAAGLIAMGSGRPASAAYALLLAAVVTLGINPRASADPGWRLSFAAVTGMLALTPRIRVRLRGLPHHLAEAVAVTAAATLATAPVLAHDFGAISLAALPANLIALPAVAPVMWIGMAEAALAQLTTLGGTPAAVVGAACRAAGIASGAGIGWVSGTARRLAQPGWAQAPIHLSTPAVVIAYAAITAAVWALPSAARRTREWLSTPRAGDLLDAWRAMPTRSRHATLVFAATLAVLAACAFVLPSRPPRELTVDYLDVGQGDATLIRDPYGAAILFDGGPPEARVDRTLHRLGVTHLSAVVATHQSRDHHGGLLQVIRRFPVDVFLDGGDGTRDPTFLALEREADARGIRRIATRRGQVLQIGALTIRILWPGPRAPGAEAGDPNLRATVAVVSEGGFDLFLSADAESGVLLPLALPRVDAMKVPHHGSGDPALPELLDRLRPRVAAIEVGRGNDYGHPRPQTLQALRRRGLYVYRTDRDGTIELTVRGGALAIRTHR
jgi:competence protein ComEC